MISLLSSGLADSWFAAVNDWSINRQSETIGLDMDSSIKGKVSAIDVTPGGLRIRGYHSRFSSVILNDVVLEDRTSAREGDVEVMDALYLRSADIEDVTRNVSKSYGSPKYIFEFHELWPVIISNHRTIRYKGSAINDREIANNNQDFVQASNFQSSDMYKISIRYLALHRMNCTVVANGSRIEYVDFLPTKTTFYSINENASGITNLKYRHLASDQKTVLGEADQRFYGTFKANMRVNMSQYHAKMENGSSACWLGCFDDN